MTRCFLKWSLKEEGPGGGDDVPSGAGLFFFFTPKNMRRENDVSTVCGLGSIKVEMHLTEHFFPALSWSTKNTSRFLQFI